MWPSSLFSVQIIYSIQVFPTFPIWEYTTSYVRIEIRKGFSMSASAHWRNYFVYNQYHQYTCTVYSHSKHRQTLANPISFSPQSLHRSSQYLFFHHDSYSQKRKQKLKKKKILWNQQSIIVHPKTKQNHR